ncbi:MAG: hypothetical protein ABSE93_01430 [Terriglobia bacterium]
MSTPSANPPTPSTPPVALTVQDFRLSFVWVETNLEIFKPTAELADSFQFLKKSERYREVFENTLAGKGLAGLEVPWHKRKKQFFWKYYLAGPALEAVSGKQAWEHVVPLRAKLPVTVKDWKKGIVTLEGFYYPHGLALAVTFRVNGPFTLDDAVKLAYDIRDGGEKFITQEDKLERSLDSLGENGLTQMRNTLFKQGGVPGKQGEAFTIFTLVKGDPFTPFELGGPVHRALQSVTEWMPDPETATLRPLPEVQVPLRGSAAAGSILFGRRRGRAIWLPGLFAKKDPKKPSLGCYHRNVLFASMQVDSLGGLVKGTANLLRNQTPLAKLDMTLKACARNAIDRLRELYEGDKDKTYRSNSPKAQIEQNYLKDLNYLQSGMK